MRDEAHNDQEDERKGLYVVGLGASAGGLAAFEEFFGGLPDNTGMAFVVVQHLSPERKSELTSILDRFASIPVATVTDDIELKPDHIYVIPPDASLSLDGDILRLGEGPHGKHPHSSIDHFFESLAEAKHDHAIAVVLSGTQTDGARGIIAIKERNGLTMVQSPKEAEYSSMPRRAIETGHVDLILPAADLAQRIAAFSPGEAARFVAEAEKDKDEQLDFEHIYRKIIARVYSVTGHDFSNYKRSTMLRRLDRRRRLRQMPNLQSYLAVLGDEVEETRALFYEVLITVTAFFRDEEAFLALENEVIPRLFEGKEADEVIRVWIPGCATGEEVYSIAMLLWEESNRRERFPNFKLFATDIDKRAITQARRAVYSEASCARLTPQRRERFFEAENGGYRVISELRDRVLFAVHDVLQDPPFARQDLVSCRNLLIYLDREAQEKVFDIIHYALGAEGYLFLGTSEFIGQARDLFTPIDKRHRIYQSKSVSPVRLPRLNSTGTKLHRDPSPKSVEISQRRSNRHSLEYGHHKLLSLNYAPPSVLVDRDYEILHVAGDVAEFLRIPAGEPTSNLLKTVIPALRLPLRTALIEAFARSNGGVSSTEVLARIGDHRSKLRLTVRPATDASVIEGDVAQVSFERISETVDDVADDFVIDVSEADESLRRAITNIEEENEELKEKLSNTIERYETTTEELKTSNEELLTINEELQFTTEELETSKEELQSSNEELTIVNGEITNKIEQLDKVNSDLKNLFASTEIGTIFLDRELHIRRFTKPVAQYFNLLYSDIGRPLDHITHQLHYETLVEDAQQVLQDLQPIDREVETHDKDWFITRILPYRTVGDRIDGIVIVFFDITERKRVQRRLAESELLFRTVFERASDGLFLYKLDDASQPSTFIEVNESASRQLGFAHDEFTSMTLRDLVDPASVDVDGHLHSLQEQGEAVTELCFRTRTGETVDEEIRSRLLTVADEQTVLTVGRDITSQKAREDALVLAKEESERLAELRASFLANMSHEIRTPLTSIIGVSQLLQKRELPEKHDQMVRLIQTSGQRLQQTLDSVLDISRIEAGEMQPRYRNLDVICQVKDDVEMLRPLADRRGIELSFLSPHKELYFWTDIRFLHRIVYNLVENAIKFTEEGQVTVRLEARQEGLELRVIDTGIGIDEEFLPHLFAKFQQASIGTSRSYDGSGLGMALVSHLVEIMGGSIDVESEKGKGTTFSIVVPPHPEDADTED